MLEERCRDASGTFDRVRASDVRRPNHKSGCALLAVQKPPVSANDPKEVEPAASLLKEVVA